MPIVYKYRPGRGPITKDQNGKDIEIFERDLKPLSEDRIFVPTPKQLNDPTEAVVEDSRLYEALELIKRLLKKSSKGISNVEEEYEHFKEHIFHAGIYSLSKTATSELMWAYYANGHNGYAIKIDTDILTKSLEGNNKSAKIYGFDIKYVSSKPKIKLDFLTDHDVNKAIQQFTGYKSKSWQHEQEYRLVFLKGGELKHIDYRVIKGFVFGYLMPQKDIEYIMELFKGRHLSYSKICLNPKNYQFYTEDIEDKYKDAPNYHPSRIQYDFDEMIEEASLYDATILSHQMEAKEALEIVACEAFVENIYLLMLSENDQTPGTYDITIGTDYKNPAVLQPKKIYRFIVDKDGSVIRTE